MGLKKISVELKQTTEQTTPNTLSALKGILELGKSYTTPNKESNDAEELSIENTMPTPKNSKTKTTSNKDTLIDTII